MKFVVLIFTIGLLLTGGLYAVPPAPGILSTKMPKDGVHINQQTAKLIGQGAPSFALAKSISANGTKKIAVIFVGFSDTALTTQQVSAYTTSSTSATSGFLKRMVDYYSECSYGQLTLQITVFTGSGSGYTLPYTMGLYALYNYYYVANGSLFHDACSAAGVTKGSFDALLVVHAGQGAESVASPSNQIWSMFTGPFSAGSDGFTEGETVPATEANGLMPFGVLCHEFGHQLGFPDLYNTSGVSYPSNIGLWDVMDYGSWANNGKSPTHPSAWSKQLVGWVTPVQLSSSSAISLRNYENYSDTYRIPILGSSTEYFLVEFRKQTRSDAYIPGNGVLIYHIDDTIGSLSANNINSISPHLRVSCVEADKNGDIPTNHGDSGDAFIDGSIFTMPQSNAYLSQSYISISNIVGYTTNLITMSYSNPRIPSVSGLSPSSGTSINPTTISITGSGFFGGVGSNTVTAVRLDNGTAITSYIVATDSLIRAAVVPSGVTAGTYNVLVYTQSGNNTTSAQTFVVQGLTGTPAKPTCTGSFTLTISWAAGTAADPISGIAGYYLQVGTSLGGADRFDGYVGNILKYNITGCSSGKTYYARVKAKNNVGVFTVYSVNSDAYSVNVVSTSKLYGNLLNPLYSPPASIQYTIGTDSVVKITVHKSNGEIIRTILNSAKNAGTYTDAVWDGKDEFGKVVASGVYYVFIDAGSYREQKKVLIVK